MVYQQIVGIPMGTNCALLIADLFLFCYERDFMTNLHKSKRYGLIDMFNDTFRYLDDIFTIDSPEEKRQNLQILVFTGVDLFQKHVPDIYPTRLNKANTSFLDLNQLLAVMFVLAFTTNAMTSEFLSSISPG